MSVIDIPLSVRQGSVLAKVWAVTAVVVPAIGRWLGRTVTRGRQLALYAGGFAAICYGVWQISGPAGWVAAGVSCLLMEGLTTKAEQPQ